MLGAATRTPAAAAANNGVDVAALDPVETSQPKDAYTRALFRLLGDEVGDLSDQEPRNRSLGAVVVEERDLQRAQASHPHGLLRVQLGDCNAMRAGQGLVPHSQPLRAVLQVTLRQSQGVVITVTFLGHATRMDARNAVARASVWLTLSLLGVLSSPSACS